MNSVIKFKRELEVNKSRYKRSLEVILKYFKIDLSGYLEIYDEYSEEIIDLLMEKELIDRKIGEIDNKFGKIKMGLLLRENINLFEELGKLEYGVRGRVVDDLFTNGFLSIEDCEMLKKWIWDNRYRESYSD